jgi:outer membrane protein OmpA-like peptidoglycan-associated protein
VITPAPAQGEHKSGGFFKKLGAHIKQRASDIKNQTAENLTNSANQMVDATTQTGTGLVAGATAQVSSAARSSVGGIGKAILPSKGQADNLAVALNYGQAEFRSRLFSGGSIPVLEPAGREVVQQFAAELKTRPGRFQIQVHVDPIENALALSKQQAGVFKNALIERGVDGSRLEAVGYGATAPRPEVPPDGGPASSARLVIVPLNAQ